jgi:hypothetical protein
MCRNSMPGQGGSVLSAALASTALAAITKLADIEHLRLLSLNVEC